MGSIKTSTGLASGIDTATLIKAILTNNQSAVRKLENRQKTIQASQTGLTQLQAGLLSIATSAQTLSSKTTFQTLQVQNSDPAQLSVSTTSVATAGFHEFQTVRLASVDQSVSRGYADANQKLGVTGQIVIGTGGSLSRPTSLDLLNQGAGVRRGTIRIADRSGSTATIDLSQALTVDDVVKTINSQTDISVQASTQGGRIVLADTSGSTAANFSVADINGGHAAADLGIAGSVASSTLTGADVFQVSSDVLLSSINDGNGLRLRSGVPELSITASDGTNLQVNLDDAKTVGNIVQAINSHASNGGKVTAALVNGKLQLTDSAGGGGTLTVANLNGSNAAQVLGLDVSPSGNVLTGKALAGGLNSVLLRNLRGGQGITTPGSISLTDRAGVSATVDLTQAQSLDEVITAINQATSAGSVKLKLTAALDANGTGITITDTSGQTTSNLIIADVSGGSVAGDLKIAVNAAANSVSSGSLGLRSVNEATTLSGYAPNGGAVTPGSFSITNAAGASAVVTLDSTSKTIGDVIDRVNATGISVTAQLNETGDGFVIVDNSTGGGTLAINALGGKTSSDLRLSGAVTTGIDGKQRITSRNAAVINVVADDTLTTLSTKFNSVGGRFRSSVIDSGAAVNPFRLSFTATATGAANRLIVDDGGLGLNVAKQTVGQDAVLRIGSDSATAFLKTSSTNTFRNAVTGYNVTLEQVSETPAQISSSINANAIAEALSSFAKNYNQLVGQIDTLTKFDQTTGARGALQGDGTVIQIENRITSLVNRITGASTSPVRSLADVGLVVGAGGQLTFSSSKFQQAIADHPTEVTNLFIDIKSGFGTALNTAITDLTDQTKGSLTAEINADKTTIENLQDQIDRVNATLANRQAYLELKYSNMETILSGLQSQQSALTALANLAGVTTTKSSNS